jgi:hypothetical protein
MALANRNKVGIAALCLSPLLLIGVVWYWNRRHYHPIAGRAPLLTIVANLILALVLLEDGKGNITKIFNNYPLEITKHQYHT